MSTEEEIIDVLNKIEQELLAEKKKIEERIKDIKMIKRYVEEKDEFLVEEFEEEIEGEALD